MALFMIASLAGLPMTPQGPMSGVMQGERADVPETRELTLLSRRTDGDDGSGGPRGCTVEAPLPLDTTDSPLALALPMQRCARAIGPDRPARSRCSCSARGPPAPRLA